MAVVFDDVFVAPPAELFEGDAVDVFLDLRPSGERGRPLYDHAVYHLRFAPNAAGGCTILGVDPGAKLGEDQLRQMRARCVRTSTGWMLEAHLPWTAFGIQIADQAELHLAFGTLDSDNPRLPGIPKLGARPIVAGPNPYSDPGAFDKLVLGRKNAQTAEMFFSADEVVLNGVPYLEVQIADLASEKRDKLMLQIGSRSPFEVEWEPSYSGAFKQFSTLLPSIKLAAESPALEITVANALGQTLWSAKSDLNLVRHRVRIEADLSENFLITLDPDRRDLARYFKEVALEITELMALGPREERTRLRQLRARDNPAYYEKFIDLFVRWAKQLPSLPADHYLMGHYRVWRSSVDDSLQLMKVELPVGYREDHAYPIEVNFHSLLRPGERYRFLTEMAKLDAGMMPYFSGKNIRVTLFGRGNSFEYLGADELSAALAWVKQKYPSSAGSPTVFSGISDGASWAFEYATRFPDQVDYLDLRSGGFTSRLIETGASFAENQLLRRLYDPKQRLENILHVRGRIAAGADDTIFSNATAALGTQLEGAGVPIEVKLLPGRGHQFELPPLELSSDTSAPKNVSSLENTPLAFAKRDGWEVISLLHFGRPWSAKSVIGQHGWEIQTENVQTLRLTRLPAGASSTTSRLRIDDTIIPIMSDSVRFPLEFERQKDGEWTPATPAASAPRKNNATSGPMAAILDRKFIFVVGTKSAKDERLIQFRLRRTIESLYGANPGQLAGARFVVKRDIDITPDELARSNLWLIGNTTQNSVYARWIDQMPIQVAPSRISGGMGTLERNDLACTFICPNPQNRSAYVYVDAGTGPAAFYAPVFQSVSMDYCVLEANGLINPILVRGFFNSAWSYVAEYSFHRH